VQRAARERREERIKAEGKTYTDDERWALRFPEGFLRGYVQLQDDVDEESEESDDDDEDFEEEQP
jgi:hypothetical protein